MKAAPDTARNDALKWGCLLAFVGLVCLWVVFGAGCGKRDIPTSQPMPPLVAWIGVTGKSMVPTFPEQALVEVHIGVPFDQLKAGDTVVFWDYLRRDGAPFTHHRLVAQQGGNWIAQGDNPATNPTADRPWVTRDNYVARSTGRHVQILVGPTKP